VGHGGGRRWAVLWFRAGRREPRQPDANPRVAVANAGGSHAPAGF